MFHAGGIDPDLVSDRILLGLTGACADVKSLRLQEMWDCSRAEAGPLKFIGFGAMPEDARKNVMAHVIPNNFTLAIARTVEHVLGVTYDRLEESHDYVATRVDIEQPFLIPAGTVAQVTHRMQG